MVQPHIASVKVAIVYALKLYIEIDGVCHILVPKDVASIA